jgi:hypothetical protein
VRAFSDTIVSSSELNRRPGEILRTAQETPVTVTHAGGDLALLRRDYARLLSESMDVLRGILFWVCKGIGGDGGCEWVLALEDEDVVAFGREILSAWQDGEDEADLRARCHEWHESVRWTHSEKARASLLASDKAWAQRRKKEGELRRGRADASRDRTP